ncbi:hypothetical protein PPROV_001090200 [Pycnococcus provasolii]|uniref:non-specific serine/threonine protein kinase n=1 Tax=Pycnococcus provasolii TaxID=41880 RepID=A0A830HYJ8_9CHLO|nr:hypothetical protein PPROV_001090200 [Pycnococcus provasolii]
MAQLPMMRAPWAPPPPPPPSQSAAASQPLGVGGVGVGVGVGAGAGVGVSSSAVVIVDASAMESVSFSSLLSRVLSSGRQSGSGSPSALGASSSRVGASSLVVDAGNEFALLIMRALASSSSSSSSSSSAAAAKSGAGPPQLAVTPTPTATNSSGGSKPMSIDKVAPGRMGNVVAASHRPMRAPWATAAPTPTTRMAAGAGAAAATTKPTISRSSSIPPEKVVIAAADRITAQMLQPGVDANASMRGALALCWLYHECPQARAALRARIGAALLPLSSSDARPRPGHAALLTVAGAVLRGVKAPLPPCVLAFVSDVLLPLHRTNAVDNASDPPTPALATIQESLATLCLAPCLELHPPLLADCLRSVAAAAARGAPSTKEVLLLREAQALVEFAPPAARKGRLAKAALSELLPHVTSAMQSDHFAVAERALRVLGSHAVLALVLEVRADAYPKLLPAVLPSDASTHWSRDVAAARLGAAEALLDADSKMFHQASDAVFGIRGGAAWAKAELDKLRERSDLAVNVPPTSSAAAAAGASSSATVALSGYDANLLFQDLVFHDVLGAGAFATVHRVRRVVKGASPSTWPWFAVKHVKTDRLAEPGVANAVRRELAVLASLGDCAGVARLVARFRFEGGAYLVLELAENGDVHTHIVSRGGLGLVAGTFVVASVSYALGFVHRRGYVYGDLKPENVLVTSTGHVKLTDFGAARPCTADAHSAVLAFSNVLAALSEGDYRVKHGLREVQAGDANFSNDADDGEAPVEDDDRVEGTVLYLSPEIVRGAVPSPLSDSWALGALARFVFVGIPLFADAADPLAAIASLDATQFPASLCPIEVAGAGPNGSASRAPADVEELVCALMAVNPSERMSAEQAAVHGALTSAHGDVSELWDRAAPALLRQPPRNNDGAPSRVATWARRQSSVAWRVGGGANDAAASLASASARDGAAPSSDLNALGRSIAETALERGASFLPGGGGGGGGGFGVLPPAPVPSRLSSMKSGEEMTKVMEE